MKVSKIIDMLQKLDLPEYDIQVARASFQKARCASKGIFWVKLVGRYWLNKKIAKKFKWTDNRLLDVYPEWKKYDIEPMQNITCNGDRVEWIETPEGGRPIEDSWLSQDKESEEYKIAVSECYWSKGNHPRSYEARKDWYRRNAGAFHVYDRGELINPMAAVRTFVYEDSKTKATFYNSGLVWQVEVERKILGKFGLKTREGFEIDNVISPEGVQRWFPIGGFLLKAPVTSSTLPYWRKD